MVKALSYKNEWLEAKDDEADLKIDGAKRRFEARGHRKRQENTLGSEAPCRI